MFRGPHPVLDLRRGSAEGVHGAEDLEPGLVGAAMAKVLGHRGSDGVTCPHEHRRRARQTISARRRIRIALVDMCRALELDETVELLLEIDGRHLDSPYQRCSPATQMRAGVDVQHHAGDLTCLGEEKDGLCDVPGARKPPQW